GYRVSPIETSTEEWDLVMGINLRGPFLVTRAVLPSMIRAGWGRVVNISSSSGRQGARIAGLPYGVAKTGINGLTRTLALEVGPECSRGAGGITLSHSRRAGRSTR